MDDETQIDLDDFVWSEQEKLDQRRRQQEMRRCCDHGRLWTPGDDNHEINWNEPF